MPSCQFHAAGTDADPRLQPEGYDLVGVTKGQEDHARPLDNFNLRAAFLEVVNDAVGSVAVIIAAIVIATTGWAGADSIAGLLIGVLIIPRAITLLIETTNVLLESTPPGLDLADVRHHLLALPDVLEVHDLHASQIATGLPILTAHVVVTAESFADGSLPQLLASVQDCVAEHFDVSVEHSTIQFEPPGRSRGCPTHG